MPGLEPGSAASKPSALLTGLSLQTSCVCFLLRRTIKVAMVMVIRETDPFPLSLSSDPSQVSNDKSHGSLLKRASDAAGLASCPQSCPLFQASCPVFLFAGVTEPLRPCWSPGAET